ncbi:MAG: Do family serine endopeptidase [Acidobacteria bacterium]|nr:Do family serine endopeptidase [Acidobacteriota bacterium]
METDDMVNRKTTFFYALLIAIASLAVGMVIASRLGMAPSSAAQTVAPPANSAPITGPLTATMFRDIAKAVSPAVVNIRTESRQRAQDLSDFFGGGGGGGGDLFERFFGQPQPGQPRQQQQPPPREEVVQAAGTGFIIDKAGFILTNNHVVEGATKIRVSLYGEDSDQEYDARVVGRDPLTDSALIELTEKPDHTLPEVKFGDSGQVFPGDWVVAIGNPFGLSHTVTVGVISAIERSFPVASQRYAQVLQTDAAINPGNSGGPLLNLRGEVVGINTAIISEGRPGNVGVGFAMPINVVRELLPQLRAGKITRGRIGVGIGPIPADAVDEFGLKDRNGAVVLNIAPSGAAAKAGLEPGDVVIAFNGKPIRNRDELVAMVTATRPGTTVPVRIVRDRQERTLNITVDELDLEAETAAQRADNSPGGGTQRETTSGFGITLGNITPEVAQRMRLNRGTQGAVVLDVEQGSPAARAGLAEGDVIVRVGRQAVANAADAGRELMRVPSGGTAFLRVVRNGQETFVAVTKE